MKTIASINLTRHSSMGVYRDFIGWMFLCNRFVEMVVGADVRGKSAYTHIKLTASTEQLTDYRKVYIRYTPADKVWESDEMDWSPDIEDFERDCRDTYPVLDKVFKQAFPELCDGEIHPIWVKIEPTGEVVDTSKSCDTLSLC